MGIIYTHYWYGSLNPRGFWPLNSWDIQVISVKELQYKSNDFPAGYQSFMVLIGL